MGSASAKWAVMAPVFVPMLMLLGYTPELTQAAYRIGDSSSNIIAPMMSYFALIVAFFERYDKRSGIGTVVATMLPYTIAFLVVWSVLLVGWMLLDLPVGPGAVAAAGAVSPFANPDEATIRTLLREVQRVVVVGLSPKPHRDSNRIARYLQEHGYEVVPVYPREEEILGQKVYRRVQDVPGPIDLVNVFRRSEHLPAVFDDILASAGPRGLDPARLRRRGRGTPGRRRRG